MSRIEDIVESEEFYDADERTQEYFDFVYELTEHYDRYEADMRISGLYYRTAKVDTESLYELSQFTEFGNDCEIKNAIDILTKPTDRKWSNKSYLDQFDFVFAKLADKGVHAMPFDADHYLRFEREPANKYDPNAIKILYQGIHCGYVPKEHAVMISYQYSAIEIKNAVGVVGKKLGDARVTFDMFLMKQKTKAKDKKVIDEEDDWDEKDEGLDDLNWEEEYEAVKAEAKEEKTEPVKDEVKGLYEGELRSNEVLGYTQEWYKGKWVPWDGTSYFNKDTYKIMVWSRAENDWHIQTKEEAAESDKRLKEFMDDCRKRDAEKEAAKADTNKVATTAYVDSNIAGLTVIPPMEQKPDNPVKGMMHMTINGGAEVYTGTQWVEIAPLVSPVFTGKVVKAKKPIPVQLDYTQYTGFLRTVLEYATFAHIR